MDVTLILADAARVHPDNTFSLLRGGIATVNVPKNAPVFFKGALLVRVAGAPSEAGAHEIRIVCIDEDGEQTGQEMTGSFVRTPEMSDVPYPVQMEPNLVIEFYSR